MSNDPEKAASGVAGDGAAPKGKKTALGGKKTAPGGKKTSKVPIRLPSGEQAWVSADAFNLISEKEFRDSERLRRLRGQRNLAVMVAAVALLVFATGAISLLTRPATSGVGEPGEPVEARLGSAETIELASGRGSSADPEIEETVQAWARAWSARDVEAVHAFYSPSFLVPDGMSRATWKQLRRERIESPELLAVTVSGLATERTGPESAVARFLQTYDTPGYRAWTMKTLKLASASGRWLIVDEVVSLTEVGTGVASGELELIQPVPGGGVTNP